MKLGFLDVHLKLQKNKTGVSEEERACFLETVGPNPLSVVVRGGETPTPPAPGWWQGRKCNHHHRTTAPSCHTHYPYQ